MNTKLLKKNGRTFKRWQDAKTKETIEMTFDEEQMEIAKKLEKRVAYAVIGKRLVNGESIDKILKEWPEFANEPNFMAEVQTEYEVQYKTKFVIPEADEIESAAEFLNDEKEEPAKAIEKAVDEIDPEILVYAEALIFEPTCFTQANLRKCLLTYSKKFPGQNPDELTKLAERSWKAKLRRARIRKI